jgi:choline-sulfatase
VRRPSPRRIVVVLADQLAAAALPMYGNGVAQAPHLKRLADDGLVFERALCASPLCVPSRASLMSGLLPSQTGAYDNAGELPAGIPTFAHRLRLLGYRTVLVGKMHFIGPDQLHGFEERPMTDVYPAGFDWIPDWDLREDERLPWYHDLSSVLRAGPVQSTLQLEYDAEVLERSLDVLGDGDPRPLLLVVSFTHPHDPYEVTEAHWARYDGVAIDAPADPEPADDPITRRLRAMIGEQPISAEQLLRARRGYYGAISLVDDHVGAILDRLDDSDVVVVTSDHGDMLGERGLWYKMAPFENSIRVPLIVRGAGSGRVPRPVSLLDLSPTLVDLAGGDHEGRSLVAGEPARTDVPVEYFAEGVRAPQVTLVRGSLKLVRSLGEEDVVYDVEADPGERVPVAAPELSAAADAMWNLHVLDREIRESQRRRRVVARALALGRLRAWDHPEGTGRYIDTGDDFWSTLERARKA